MCVMFDYKKFAWTELKVSNLKVRNSSIFARDLQCPTDVVSDGSVVKRAFGFATGGSRPCALKCPFHFENRAKWMLHKSGAVCPIRTLVRTSKSNDPRPVQHLCRCRVYEAERHRPAQKCRSWCLILFLRKSAWSWKTPHSADQYVAMSLFLVLTR